MSLTRRDILLLTAAVVATRIALTLIGTLAVVYLPATKGDEFKHLLDGGPALDQWYRWDAGFYATIATFGYDWQNEQRISEDMAFFPLYPAAIRVVMDVTGCRFSPYLSTCATVGGLIVSNLALLAATIILFDLTIRHADKRTAWGAAALLLLSPGSIYLSGVYTEGLFLLLTLLTFWFLDRDRFAAAAVTAGLAALTRSVGVALYPTLLWVAWHVPSPVSPPQCAGEGMGAGSKRIFCLLLAHIPLICFGAYILIAGLTAGDPLGYFKAYSTSWGRTTSSPLEAFTIYFSGESVALFGWSPAWIDLAATFAYGALAIIVIRRRVEWGIFALVSLLIPIMTGTLLSMPRFGTVIFPFYIVLAGWARQRWQQALLYSVSIVLMIFVVTRFVTWKWIA